ncbi:hypothetical protein TNCV_1219051 [Trichonephila clavipes]|nr:hypothetical protein TNCV_1219051 [Trichonephila clavipes]
MVFFDIHLWISFTPNAAVLFVDVAIQPEVRFIAKQNSLMKIGNNGNLVLGPFDESKSVVQAQYMYTMISFFGQHHRHLLKSLPSILFKPPKNIPFGVIITVNSNLAAVFSRSLKTVLKSRPWKGMAHYLGNERRKNNVGKHRPGRLDDHPLQSPCTLPGNEWVQSFGFMHLGFW